MCMKKAGLQHAPLTCQQNNCCALTKPKCKHSACRKIFAFLIVELTSRPDTVNLKMLLHYLHSTKLSPRLCCLRARCLITIAASGKRGQHRAINTMNYHSRDDIMNPRSTRGPSRQVDNVQRTQRVTHAEIRHMRCTRCPPRLTCLPRPAPCLAGGQKAVFILRDRNSPCGPHICILPHIHLSKCSPCVLAVHMPCTYTRYAESLGGEGSHTDMYLSSHTHTHTQTTR